jgi:hypothetical protein
VKAPAAGVRRICSVLAGVIAIIAAGSAVSRETTVDPAFEKPVAVKRVRLGPAQTVPVSYKEIRCSYFVGVMVKEWDEQEIGDKEIAYVLTQGGVTPACQKAALPAEHKLPVDDAAVYFLGYAGGAIFVTDADGANGTIGFYVFDLKTGRKRFTDTTKLDSKFAAISADGNALRLGYTRAMTGPCSVVVDGADCWARIARQAGFSGAPPDCAAGYREASQKFAEEACGLQHSDKKKCLAEQTARRTEWDKTPSVVAFDVTATVGPDDSVAVTPAGGPAQCWPSD